MTNEAKGFFVELDGEPFYKIENFDAMQDFFMTLTSGSDIWNFLWAQGGITAGRRNSDSSIFPYSTCDKLSDGKNSTGALTIIKIIRDGGRGRFWQPFASLLSQGADHYAENLHVKRNLYKNLNGSKVWFEEINVLEGLAFRYGWTSSNRYGLVKLVHVENISENSVKLQILDGARNIMSAQSSSAIQDTKSVLLDAYKKCELSEEAGIALFSLSSVVTDKAEPSECLLTNVSWFTTADDVIISDTAVREFVQAPSTNQYGGVECKKQLLGKRGECYIVHNAELKPDQAECWEQVFDVNLDAAHLASLQADVADRSEAWKKLLIDIKQTDAKLTSLIAAADGLQQCESQSQSLHHRENVLFNIMRGGLFADEGAIRPNDFVRFVSERNKALVDAASAVADSCAEKAGVQLSEPVPYADFEQAVLGATGLTPETGAQLYRLFLEYLPLTFSRRHGDPSRPWNSFSIELTDSDGNEKRSFEGNWRDIFQNWEALAWSYPCYIKNMCAVFLNAMNLDGFNPYRISRAGIDWEVPDAADPWSQYGYWTDHQVIYLQRLLEFYQSFDRKDFLDLFGKQVFSASNIPYRIKAYKDIVADPRHSIDFDAAQDAAIKAAEKDYGTDRRLVLDADGNVQLFTLGTKLLQLVLAKALNHIPGAGIWMNMQRPEWNDANNALAGSGASVVTLCYLYRMVRFLAKTFAELRSVTVDGTVLRFLKATAALYADAGAVSVTDAVRRREFVDKAGALFEQELSELHAAPRFENVNVDGLEISAMLETLNGVIRMSILHNKRADDMFHSYNIVSFADADGKAGAIDVDELQLMLEGQVAVLSAGILSNAEAVALIEALRKSALYEPHQLSYLLYPQVTLAAFEAKNCISAETLSAPEYSAVSAYIARAKQTVLHTDCNGVLHFDAALRNADCLENALEALPAEAQPNAQEKQALLLLYEATFNHKRFTGRSGCFYAYEGIGCIYWHQVSKLLLAVQENVLHYPVKALKSFYKDIKAGLGYQKTPVVYGAFPCDPYSHTPYLGGAKQPGMTGQVKEEIVARFCELGLYVQDSCCVFNPVLLDKNEFCADGTLTFSWCGTKIIYSHKLKSGCFVEYADGAQEYITGNMLHKKASRQLLYRTGDIKQITVSVK